MTRPRCSNQVRASLARFCNNYRFDDRKALFGWNCNTFKRPSRQLPRHFVATPISACRTVLSRQAKGRRKHSAPPHVSLGIQDEIPTQETGSALPASFGAGSVSMLLLQRRQPPRLSIGTIEKREITGSNIKSTDTETASPMQVITREDIDATGLNTISDVVRQITANSNGTMANAGRPRLCAGASGVSLRGLGIAKHARLAQRTSPGGVRARRRRQELVRRSEPGADGHRRTDRSPEVGCVGGVRLRRRRGCRQHHYAAAVHRRRHQRHGGTSYKNDDNTYRGSSPWARAT